MKVMLNLVLALAIFGACKPANSSGEASASLAENKNATRAVDQLQVFVGETMGTTYSMKYGGALQEDLKEAVDHLLVDINKSVSTYVDKSIISSFNKANAGVEFKVNRFSANQQKYFIDNYNISSEIYRSSGRNFDPTVMPIVNYWGFGYDGRKKITRVDSTQIKKLLSAVGMNNITYNASQQSWTKRIDEVELDFSAVAKGYAVDQVSSLFEERGISVYYIEIGGECKAKGTKNGGNWTIGVALPDPKAGLSDIVTKIDLINSAVATSGNYRNFYEVDGEVISHTINPRTGFPERNTLLSATVFHPSCARADALATACMSMGFDEGFPYIDEMPGAECFMVYLSSQGQVLEAASAGIGQLIH